MSSDETKFVVRVSLFAREQFREAKQNAEHSPNSSHAKTWRVVREIAATKLCQPDIALEATHAMKGELANLFRWKFGRNRLIYIASSEKRQVTILMLGFRKEGDANDAYEVLRRRLKSGEFDQLFFDLGVAKPGVRQPSS
jgi:hypothetical protein